MPSSSPFICEYKIANISLCPIWWFEYWSSEC